MDKTPESLTLAHRSVKKYVESLLALPFGRDVAGVFVGPDL